MLNLVPRSTAGRELSWLHGGVGNPDHRALERELDAIDSGLPEAQRLMRRGELLAELARIDEAFDALHAATRAAPDDVNTWVALGQLEIKSGRWPELVRTQKRVLELEPERAVAYADMCWAYRRMHRLDESVAAGRKGLEVDPDNVLLHEYLAYTYLAADDCAAAQTECETALTLDPNNVTGMALGAAALDGLGQRDTGRALMDFERFVWMAEVASPKGYPSVAAFNDALAELVMATPTRPLDDTQTVDLFVDPHGPMEVFQGLVGEAFARYQQQIGIGRSGVPAHPYLDAMPSRWSIEGWATRVSASGDIEHHLHRHGWVSGVYYVRMPDFVGRPESGIAGCLEFCRFPEHSSRPVESEFAAIPPREGLMVLFPSYFYHRVSPFEGDEMRISIAFNLIPAA